MVELHTLNENNHSRSTSNNMSLEVESSWLLSHVVTQLSQQAKATMNCTQTSSFKICQARQMINSRTSASTCGDISGSLSNRAQVRLSLIIKGCASAQLCSARTAGVGMLSCRATTTSAGTRGNRIPYSVHGPS
jgi:hypothetical protein